MRVHPPPQLVEQLERLQLATAADFDAVQGRVRLLAHDLPAFPTLWVDALAQARKITPFQAAEINAGRGEQLVVGPYVVLKPILSLGYADCYRARDVRTQRVIELLIASTASSPASRTQACSVVSSDGPVGCLQRLVDQLAAIGNRHIMRPEAVGSDNDRLWIACPVAVGRSLSDVIWRNGRLPGDAVVAIARQMAAALAALEAAEIVHGDLSPRTVWIDDRGLAQLKWCGVRGIVRPDEDFSRPDLSPEAYDYLAPERVRETSPSDVSSDLFSCGALWWHLLTGRPSFGGGTSRGKIHAIGAARITDVKRFAPDAPHLLTAAIKACMNADPRQRPESFDVLAGQLGTSHASGRRTVSVVYRKVSGGHRGVVHTIQTAVQSRNTKTWAATLAGCAAVIVAVAWPLLRGPVPKTNAQRTSVASAQSPARLPNSRQSEPRIANVEQSGVLPAAYVEPDGRDRRGHQTGKVSVAPPLVLPADHSIAWNPAIDVLHPGQTVSGRAGERPLVMVPTRGLVVAVDDVRFENIDFVWRPAADAPIDPEHMAILDLRASQARFSGCTFLAADPGPSGRPAAISWSGPQHATSLPPAGRLHLNDCVASGVSAGVDIRLSAPIELTVSNTLHLGPGPLLRIDHLPRVDETIAVMLSNSTLRDATGLVGLRTQRTPPSEAGTISITTNDCVLLPNSSGALMLFAGQLPAGTLARSIQWTGQGSLVPTGVRISARVESNEERTADEPEISIDGLVSGRVEFAGPPDAGSSASRITRGTAPTQSPEPPGIPDGLPNLPSLGITEQ
jgi:serine/threonine protein kinase